MLKHHVVACVVLMLSSIVAKAEQSVRSVLLIEQSAPTAPFSDLFRKSFFTALNKELKPTAFFVEALDTRRFSGPRLDTIRDDYLANKFRDRKMGVIAAVGSDALAAGVRLRDQLWPSLPIVFIDFDSELATGLPPFSTGMLVPLRFSNLVEAAKILVPGLKQIVVVGDRFEEQLYRRHYRDQLAEYAKYFEVMDLSGLALDQVQPMLTQLPRSSAIIFTSFYRQDDVKEVNPTAALKVLAQSANRPIIVDTDTQIGTGGAGGLVITTSLIAAQLNQLAMRALDGQLGAASATVYDAVKPMFDWRQLQRFHIDTSRLPPGSDVVFHELNYWESNPKTAIAILVVTIGQAAIIAFLLIEHARRLHAEHDSHRYLEAMTQMDRSVTVGALSSSIAHELYQPLGAILSNADAAEILLQKSPPPIAELRNIISDIRHDDQRATEIMSLLRALLHKSELSRQQVDLNGVIETVAKMIGPEAKKRNIAVVCDYASGPVLVRADAVHLQQVFLNLGVNALDAMKTRSEGVLSFRCAMESEFKAIVSVSDNGTGIPDDDLEDVFLPSYSTKPEGIGLGLFIVRTIVEAYGGKIWAENGTAGGAAFKIELPLAASAGISQTKNHDSEWRPS